ncbi:hypothetical protein B1F79_01820 [Coxiella-like endosymbiont of Rhipicephalus sanguineus]|uniref:hypothetical protein n=1 Tax=Coxiella-like endosymbiont of Rhipicephalus sanguineus TaxID=1955402 RepID=UPI00203EEFA2|nr:hypothetical protein [Coxiella-like endosymbiont of Rhipicephalus sanguineus]MBT8506397.1 hypothetical protein [Coxiella-like endosymbiont of Rhipicephalus sanguineus]
MIAVYQMLIGINKFFHNENDDDVVAAARERQLEHDSDRMRDRIKVSASIGVQREFQNHAVTLSPQEQETLDKYLIRIPLYRAVAYITAGVICLGFSRW